MKTQEQVKNFNEEKFKRTFGVDRQTFQVMLSELEEQYKIAHRKGGRRPKLTVFTIEIIEPLRILLMIMMSLQVLSLT